MVKVNVHRLTLKRVVHLLSSPHSVLRTLQNEFLSVMKISSGRFLDVGGGKEVRYVNLIPSASKLESINIDPNVKPTIISDLNQELPIADSTYDGVISFNTLEHIREDEQLVTETFRILKSEGTFHFMVPFLYPVHGSPYDFHRHTQGYWIDLLSKKGFSAIEVTVLGSGPWMAAASCVPSSRFGRLARSVLLLFEWASQLRLPRQDILPEPHASRLGNWAVGYYVTAVK